MNIHDYQSNTVFQVLHVLGFDCTSDEDFDSDVSSRKDDWLNKSPHDMGLTFVIWLISNDFYDIRCHVTHVGNES